MCRHRTAARIVTRFANPTVPGPLNDDAVEHTWPSFQGTLEDLLLSDDHAQWVDEVSVRVQVIAGSKDPLMDHGFLRRLDQRSSVRLDLVPGGHDLPLRDPGTCISEIRAAATSFGVTV